MIRHQDYLDVSLAQDRESFESRLLNFANRLDFGLVSTALVVERPGRESLFISAGNRPEGFLEASKNVPDSRRDPVLRRLKKLSVPFIYDQRLYVDEGAAESRESARWSLADDVLRPREAFVDRLLDVGELALEDVRDLDGRQLTREPKLEDFRHLARGIDS